MLSARSLTSFRLLDHLPEPGDEDGVGAGVLLYFAQISDSEEAQRRSFVIRTGAGVGLKVDQANGDFNDGKRGSGLLLRAFPEERQRAGSALWQLWLGLG